MQIHLKTFFSRRGKRNHTETIKNEIQNWKTKFCTQSEGHAGNSGNIERGQMIQKKSRSRENRKINQTKRKSGKETHQEKRTNLRKHTSPKTGTKIQKQIVFSGEKGIQKIAQR